MERTKGTPQGGVVSPLLANLFLHYAFDVWMQRTCPGVPFERYADDAIVHCKSEQQARAVLAAIRGRFEQCGLALHPRRRGLVLQGRYRTGSYEHVSFDFLGFTFQPRRAQNRWEKDFLRLPAGDQHQGRQANSADHPRMADGVHQATLTPGGVFGPTDPPGGARVDELLRPLLPIDVCSDAQHLNEALVGWARRKYKRFSTASGRRGSGCDAVARRDPQSFALWQLGVKPEAEREEPDEARVACPVL